MANLPERQVEPRWEMSLATIIKKLKETRTQKDREEFSILINLGKQRYREENKPQNVKLK